MTAVPTRPNPEALKADVAERVAAGAAWLDVMHPGWRSRIDTEEFDIESGCACILGQLYREAAVAAGAPSGFALATLADDEGSTWARSHGFLWSTHNVFGADFETEAKALQQAWLDEIAKGQA